MRSERLYHGTNGDNVLGIIAAGRMRPDADGCMFFARHEWSHVLQHGGDRKRKAAFALALDVDIPASALVESRATPGIPDTFVVRTRAPLEVRAVCLFVRNPGATRAEQISGADAITRYLTARHGPVTRDADE